jgi:hypothetical protein
VTFFEEWAPKTADSLLFSLPAGKSPQWRPVSQDCAHHQEVAVSGDGLHGLEISRPYKALAGSNRVCDSHLAGLSAFRARPRRRVSGHKISFPKSALMASRATMSETRTRRESWSETRGHG